jgi:hypothetical protein
LWLISRLTVAALQCSPRPLAQAQTLFKAYGNGLAVFVAQLAVAGFSVDGYTLE